MSTVITPRVAAESATKARQAAYAATTPAKHRVAVQKSLGGRLPPRQAIRVKRLTCSNFQRDEITGCKVVTCPLWAIRPYRTATPEAA